MKKTICAAIAAAAVQLLAVTSALASPVTYDLTATFTGGATVTGSFTVDGNTLTDFDLTLPSLPEPAYSTITPSNSYISISSLPSTQIESTYYDAGSFYAAFLNLDLTSLPTDANPTSLGFSSLLQAPAYAGASWDYIGFLQSSSITLDTPVSATPLPATLPLFAGGLGFVGYLARRRKRSYSSALAIA
jgi:PEP-CTERM motif